MINKNNDTVDTKKLLISAVIKFVLILIIVFLLLFIPAGTLKYWNGWLFICALFIPVIFVISYLIKNDPELLKKRMSSKEKERPQKILIKLSFIPFLISFIIPGLDYRYGWSGVPLWLVITALVIMLSSYAAIILVFKQNSYASRIIEVQQGQKVIDYGLYSIVRHPMYSASIMLYLGIPIVLGSYYSLIPILFFIPIFYFRIKNEEEVLIKGLDGYADYIKKVKYRLIPFVW